ncbi:MAG: hypothetical protein ACRDSJ_13765 [Rubrobacteraceae bacterium]
MEQLYTRKAIVAILALVLGVNAVLLYQQFGPEELPTANAPFFGDSPQAPDVSPTPENDGDDQERETEDPRDRDQEPEESDAQENDIPDGEPSEEEPSETEPSEEEPADESFPSGESGETPFDSQYDPPTDPGGDDFDPDGLNGAGLATGVLSAVYDPEEGMRLLPKTGGSPLLPAILVGSALAVLAAIRRRD